MWPGHHCGMGNMVNGKWQMAFCAARRGRGGGKVGKLVVAATLALVLLGRQQSQLSVWRAAQKVSLAKG